MQLTYTSGIENLCMAICRCVQPGGAFAILQAIPYAYSGWLLLYVIVKPAANEATEFHERLARLVSANLLCGDAPCNSIRSLMKGQEEGVPLCGDFIPIVSAQLGSDHMIVHNYGFVHHLSILHVQSLCLWHKRCHLERRMLPVWSCTSSSS